LTLCVIALLVSCSGGRRAPPPPAIDPRATWFQLREGKLQKIAGVSGIVETPLQPWTVQSRISDTAFLGNTPYLAVNGSGLAALDLGAAGPSLRYFYDKLIFPHRTLTDLVPRRGVITAHLYFNELLNTVEPAELPLSAISLVSFIPSSSDYTFLTPPFQRKHADWEAVGFLPIGENDFFFEWKWSGKNETRFSYVHFHPDTGIETAVSRNDYLAAFKQAVSEESGAPKPPNALFELCRGSLRNLPADTAVCFALRSAGDPVKRVFRSVEGSTSSVTIPVSQDGESGFALLPDGKVIRAKASGSVENIILPALPSNARYTDIVRADGYLFLPWEVAVFTDVGAAGALLYRITP
jgi:hypothetical protein